MACCIEHGQVLYGVGVQEREHLRKVGAVAVAALSCQQDGLLFFEEDEARLAQVHQHRLFVQVENEQVWDAQHPVFGKAAAHKRCPVLSHVTGSHTVRLVPSSSLVTPLELNMHV